MTIVPVTVGSSITTTDGTATTTGSITDIVAGDVVLLVTNNTRTTSNVEDVAWSSSWGVTWNSLTSNPWTTGGGTNRRLQSAWYYFPEAPGSGTVTTTFSNTHTGFILYAVRFPGVNPREPFIQATTSSGTSATQTLTLPAQSRSGSSGFSVVAINVNQDPAPTANWTELADSAAILTPTIRVNTQYATTAYDTAAGTTSGGTPQYGNMGWEVVPRNDVVVV